MTRSITGDGGARQGAATPLLVSRAEAIALGLSRYFTGEPCDGRHTAERYASTRHCVQCVAKRAERRKEERWARRAARNALRTKPRRAKWRPGRDDPRYPGPRGEALAAGLTRYSIGSACSRGHNGERMVSNGRCVTCVADASKVKNAAARAAREAINPPPTPEERQARLLVRKRHHAAKRRAQKMGLLGKIDRFDSIRLCEQQGWKCAGCGKSVRKKYHVDHIMPLSRGGLHDRRNLQILCPPCNLDKRAKHPVDWALSMGRLV